MATCDECAYKPCERLREYQIALGNQAGISVGSAAEDCNDAALDRFEMMDGCPDFKPKETSDAQAPRNLR